MDEAAVRTLVVFTIELQFEDVYRRLFSSTDDGRLAFGFSATSIDPCDKAQLELGTDFRDFILERIVKYRLRLERAKFGTMVGVAAYGDHRVDGIIPAVRNYLRAAQIDAIEMALPDPSQGTL